MSRFARQQKKELDFLMQERPQGYEIIVDYLDKRNLNNKQRKVLNKVIKEDRVIAEAFLMGEMQRSQHLGLPIDLDFNKALKLERKRRSSQRPLSQRARHEDAVARAKDELKQMPGITDKEVEALATKGGRYQYRISTAKDGTPILVEVPIPFGEFRQHNPGTLMQFKLFAEQVRREQERGLFGVDERLLIPSVSPSIHLTQATIRHGLPSFSGSKKVKIDPQTKQEIRTLGSGGERERASMQRPPIGMGRTADQEMGRDRYTGAYQDPPYYNVAGDYVVDPIDPGHKIPHNRAPFLSNDSRNVFEQNASLNRFLGGTSDKEPQEYIPEYYDQAYENRKGQAFHASKEGDPSFIEHLDDLAYVDMDFAGIPLTEPIDDLGSFLVENPGIYQLGSGQEGLTVSYFPNDKIAREKLRRLGQTSPKTD